MPSKYQDTDINLYKARIEEVGEAAKQQGLTNIYLKCVQEWKQVVEYERSMETPWSKKN